MLIALCDYARQHNRSSDTVRRLAESGMLTTAQKIGRNWVVDSNEAYPSKKKVAKRPITVVSLFSGCGGMDLGLIFGQMKSTPLHVRHIEIILETILSKVI